MRIGTLQFVTLATIAAAVACAFWLALLAPTRPFGTPHQDASIGVIADIADIVDLSADLAPTAAGHAASSPAASQAASF